ncbi:hypothetical protein [Nocardioides salsibiostraticola]
METPAIFRRGTWKFYESMIGPSHNLKPSVTFKYGIKGDRPVAGDWNGDGRTDIGVVRGRTWFLSLPGYAASAPSPRTWRKFNFGRRYGTPVVGDWSKRGRDSVGSYFGGTWRLKKAARGNSRSWKRSLTRFVKHRRNDAAVAGDWNGNGRDGIGIVRRNSWRLLGHPVRRKQWSTVFVRRPRTGMTPAPWSTSADKQGELCPTAAPRKLAASRIVAPTGLTGAAPVPQGDGVADVRKALQRVERYLLNSHDEETWEPLRYQNFIDIRSQNPNKEIAYRGPAMSALTVATALSTDVHDTSEVGSNRQTANEYVTSLVGSISCQHRSVTPGGWGHSWQSAHWAALTAQAAWLVWDEQPEPVRTYVEAMVRSEADRLLTRPAEYWKDRAGAVNPGRTGNTAAEESAWNGSLLSLAVAMLPASEATARYRAQEIQLQASAFAAPRDLLSDQVINGVPLRDRLSGTNALDDGTVINHHLLHPDYMGNIQMLWWGYDFAMLAGGSVTQAASHQAELVYGAFSTLDFTEGEVSAAGRGQRYLAPGGTIYRPDDTFPTDVYFPEGSDWGTTRRAPLMSLDAHAVALGLAPEGSWSAREALAVHAAGQLQLGASRDSGRTYSADAEIARSQDRYPAREEYAASQVASAWLALVLHQVGTPPVDAATYPVPLVNVGAPAKAPPRSARLSP